MRLQPIIYTTDVARLAAWWEAVLDQPPASRSDFWTTFEVGDATLALHHVDARPDASRMAISLVVGGSLDDLAIELAERKVTGVGAIQDQPFGRQLALADPDGNVIQINEHRS